MSPMGKCLIWPIRHLPMMGICPPWWVYVAMGICRMGICRLTIIWQLIGLVPWTWFCPKEIVPGVFLGPYASAGKKMAESLKTAGITHIICVRLSTLLIFLFKMLSTFIWFKLKPSFQARCGEKLNQASPWGWVNPQSHALIVLSIEQSDHIWSTLSTL